MADEVPSRAAAGIAAVGDARPRQRRKEARPAELMVAALEIFVDKGFAATRLEEIAARAGVSKGTVYLYFESKDALFKAAIEAAMMPVVEAVESIADRASLSAAELMRQFVFDWWRLVGSTTLGGLPKLLVAESGNFPEVARWFHEAMISRVQRAMAHLIELGIEREEFRPIDPMLAARIVFAPMFSLAVWRRAFPDCMSDLPEPQRYLDTALELLNHGLRKNSP